MKLGRLENIDLRKQWEKEDKDFTPWLAEEENIQLLGETIGIELEVVAQEESVGPFRADILCLDTNDDHFVLIENQLEKTNHTHLGQLMTYAAGLDAVTIIWVAQRFTEEHRAALDWLNGITDDTFNFFGLEIELFRIGKSLAAPHFKLVSKPNDWSQAVKSSARAEGVSEVKQLQFEYWTKLNDHMIERNCTVSLRKPKPQHWTTAAIGRSRFHLSATLNSFKNKITVKLTIRGPYAKTRFDRLKEVTEEQAYDMLGKGLEWRRMDNSKYSFIELSRDADYKDRSTWPEQFDWFTKTLDSFNAIFRPAIKEL